MTTTGRIVLAGGTGFVGRFLREQLSDRYPVEILDQNSPDALRDNETFHAIDLADAEQIQSYFAETPSNEIGAVVYLAAYYNFSNAADSRYEALNKGLKVWMAQMEEHLPSHVPFVYASSMTAIAPTELGKKNTPDGPKIATWQYPKSKVDGETILETGNWSRPIYELVLAAVYSDWCELITLYHMIEGIRQSHAKRLFYPGDLRHGLTFVHGEDAAKAFVAAIEKGQQAKPGIYRYLVGEPEPYSYQSIQRLVTEVFDLPKTRLIRVPKAVAKSGVHVLHSLAKLLGLPPEFVQAWMIDHVDDHFHFDLDRSKTELQWSPKRRIADELPKILGRAVEQEKAWYQRNQARPGSH